MSVESIAIALHHSKASGTAKIVLIGIANHDGDGGAWPSVATLAKYANANARNTQKAIATLEALGEIRRLTQAGGNELTPGHLRPNRYRFLLRCPPWCDRTSSHKDARKPLVKISDDELSTGVSDATPGVASDRGGVSHPTPEPSFNRTIETKTLNSSNRAREIYGTDDLCPAGHKLVDDRCVYGCLADFEQREQRNAVHA